MTLQTNYRPFDVDTDFVIPAEWRKGVAIEDNPYPSLLVDITSRCNMRCNFCYYRERNIPDMSVAFFTRLCENLPEPIIMKLAGGEPTLHPHLDEFVRIAVANRHRIYVCSNGLRYSDPQFLESMHKVGRDGNTFCLGMSMDGGTSNGRAYETINGRDCTREKNEAFKALVASRVARVCLTAIIVRGWNESVIPELLNLADEHSDEVRYIHLRNAGRVGEFADTEPYTLEELKGLMGEHFTDDQMRPQCVGEIHCPAHASRNCCFRFRPTRRLQISLVEFASERAANCPKRGRMILESDKIYPLFHSIREEM